MATVAPKPTEVLEKPDLPTSNEMMQRTLELMRLEAQIAKDMDAYQKRPKRRFVGARAEEYRFARYVEDWRLKVEGIGNRNYPEAARAQKLYGSLLLTVSIRADGSLENVEVNRSSGQKILDAAAVKIVEMSAPFAAFPPDIRRDTDILHHHPHLDVRQRRRAGDQMTGAGVDRYAVVGNPIAHSKSPQIHAAFAQATGQAISYVRLFAPLDAFEPTVMQFARESGRGLNVTLPFKEQAYALAGEHSERATAAGACNTLAWRGDHWFGDNTDGVGLLRDLMHARGERVAGRRVLVLGAGGAARGILAPLMAEAPSQLAIANRNPQRAAALAAMFAARGPVAVLAPGELPHQRFDIVINATSAAFSAAGTGDDEAAAPWEAVSFAEDALAYDLSYANEPTPFMRWSGEQGAARVTDGLGMLIEQAAESFVLWRGVRPDTEGVASLLRPAA